MRRLNNQKEHLLVAFNNVHVRFYGIHGKEHELVAIWAKVLYDQCTQADMLMM